MAVIAMLDRPVTYRGNNPKKPRVTMEKLRSMVEERRKGCADVIIESRRLDIVAAIDNPKDGAGNMVRLEDGHYVCTALAWRQLCAAYRIPAEYANRVDAKERTRLFRYWQEHDPRRQIMLRVRTKTQKPEAVRVVRCVAEPNTSRFDHHVMLDHLARLIDRKGFVIHHMDLNDEGLHLSIGAAELFDTVGDISGPTRILGKTAKDPVVFGIQFANSEVDAFDFEVDLSVLRLVCTNGLVGWDPAATYKKAKRWGDILGFRDACEEALHEMAARQTLAVRYLREARLRIYDPAKREHEKVVSKVFKGYGLTGGGYLDETLMRWQKFPSGNPADSVRPKSYTKFGLIDAMTVQAQGFSDRRQQAKWEQAAGRLLAADTSSL